MIDNYRGLIENLTAALMPVQYALYRLIHMLPSWLPALVLAAMLVVCLAQVTKDKWKWKNRKNQ